jgi:hypothetical protein
MPLQRRLPKRGFTNIFKKKYHVINLGDLPLPLGEGLKVNDELLRKLKIIKGPKLPIRVLGEGEINDAVTYEVHYASKAAKAKIEKAGGTLIILPLDSFKPSSKGKAKPVKKEAQKQVKLDKDAQPEIPAEAEAQAQPEVPAEPEAPAEAEAEAEAQAQPEAPAEPEAQAPEEQESEPKPEE